MKVSVLLFAGLAEAAGDDRVDLEWDGGSARDLLGRLTEAYPDLGARLARCRVAVDHVFVEEGEAVPVGSEIAIIPPVAGG